MSAFEGAVLTVRVVIKDMCRVTVYRVRNKCKQFGVASNIAGSIVFGEYVVLHGHGDSGIGAICPHSGCYTLQFCSSWLHSICMMP